MITELRLNETKCDREDARGEGIQGGQGRSTSGRGTDWAREQARHQNRVAVAAAESRFKRSTREVLVVRRSENHGDGEAEGGAVRRDCKVAVCLCGGVCVVFVVASELRVCEEDMKE